MIIGYLIFFLLGIVAFFLMAKFGLSIRIAAALAIFMIPSIILTVWVVRIGDKPPPGAITIIPVPESSFEIAHESRLPRWFTLPLGLSRSDVTVTMNYYVKSSGRTSEFILLDSKKNKLAVVKGVQKGLQPLTPKNPPPGFPAGYPSYEIITVNGVTEIIEHRKMEPIFYITDDPAVWVEFGARKR